MNTLNYHHLYYFWTVAREKSFTRASGKLRIAQSAVSMQVAQLENFLGKKLILRATSKKLSLTEEGQAVFDQAEEIFRQGRELVDGVRDQGFHSLVRVGALGSLSKNLQIRLLRPIIESESFELNIDIGDSNTLLGRLLAFHLDAILCDVPFPHSEDEPLIQRQVARERFCLVSRLRRGNTSLSERVTKHGLYLPAKSNPATSEIEASFRHQKMKPLVKGYIDDIALLRLLALETDSLVAIPRVGAERELNSKVLHVIHEYRSLFQKFYIVTRQRGNRSNALLSLLGL